MPEYKIWSKLRSQRSRKGLLGEVSRRTLESRASEHRGCEGGMGYVCVCEGVCHWEKGRWEGQAEGEQVRRRNK